MDISGYLHTAKLMAIISFCFGTLIFVLYCLAHQDSEMVVIGFYYVILAGVSNFMMLLVLLGVACMRMDAIDDIAKSILLLLANIPVAVIYFLLVMSL
jgi:hypothetical protein